MVSFLMSCDKENRELVPLSPTVRAWASFQDGSYWIYQNDSTGTQDSMFVGYNGTEVYPAAENTYDVETVNTTITNTEDILLGFIFAVGIKEIAFEDFGTGIDYHCAAGFTIESGEVKEEKIIKGYYAWSVKPVSDKEIHGTLYEDVILVEVNTLDQDGMIVEDILNRFWISKNNWIIKKTYSNNGKAYSWSLLRKNIIQ